jgi:molecular chaperone HtpG
MSQETFTFQAEVSRLLEIVAHSLYSEREVFLRELISNASDACDRLRYEALTNATLGSTDDLKIELIPDKARRTLTIRDNGIGMSREEVIQNLGTIARSGTGEFLKKMAENKAAGSPSLIGQFGVGFYSAFMVSDEVQVKTHSIGHPPVLWVSNGQGSFTIEDAEGDLPRGTSITLMLKEGADEFLTEARLKEIVTRYSDHIAFPIVTPGEEPGLQKTLNSASALWLKSPKDITPEQYKEFYHHNGHAFDDPAMTLHWHAEGTIDYRALLFVPASKPFDLFDPQRRHHVKLYARRVFITESAEGLLPPYLRFVKGVVDSEDLPLNVSREMLQNNPVVSKIKSGLTKRILGDLAKEAKNPERTELYNEFLENFSAVLKEGIYEDKDHQTLILKLLRFHTTRTVQEDGKPVDLETYISRMRDGQDSIITMTGPSRDAVLNSPQLEGFKARGIEVLLLTDAVDDFWLAQVEAFEGKKFQSATRGLTDLDKVEKVEKTEIEPPPADLAKLIAALKTALGDSVQDVRASKRLTNSAVCFVAGDSDIDINLERLLRAHKQVPQGLKRVLEINPGHALIRQLAKLAEDPAQAEDVQDMGWLLLDQARILEGEPLPDPVAFSSRMARFLGMGLGKAAA